jgi:septal ring factor EnvC (AmiA/AmiB activator)
LEEFKLVPAESIFFDLTPEEVTLFFYVLGLNVAQSLTIDELNVLANGLFELAQVLFVIASQRTLINDAIKAQQEKDDADKAKEEKKSAEKLESDVKKLQDKIAYLQKQIDELKK